MPTLPFRVAWRVIRRIQPDAPLGTRLHVAGRFLSCPFGRVLEALPGAVPVLDVGAGHGIFAHLAAASGAASVLAVEPDVRKLLGGGRSPDGVRWVCGFLDSLDPLSGRFGAVAMLDVLYRVPMPAWDPLLRQMLERLTPGGVLLLKEIDPSHRVRGWLNRLQERLADAVGLTLGDAFSYEPPEVMRARLERLGYVDIEVLDLARGYPHAHVLYKARRRADGLAAR